MLALVEQTVAPGPVWGRGSDAWGCCGGPELAGAGAVCHQTCGVNAVPPVAGGDCAVGGGCWSESPDHAVIRSALNGGRGLFEPPQPPLR